MGTYKKGILGAFSGKVGTVVGSFWRGIAYIRSLASNVRNPRTESQMWNRGLMRFTVEKLRPFLPAIRVGFVGTGNVSPWSKAVQVNKRIIASLSEAGGDYVFDASRLVLSSGSEVLGFTASLGRGSAGVVTWDPSTVSSDFAGGRVYVVGVSKSTGRMIMTYGSMDSGTLTVDLNGVRSGDDDEFSFYGFAVNGSRSTATYCF